MQKLVTVYLNEGGYWELASEGKSLTLGTPLHKVHGLVEEHLEHYLSDGWVVSSIVGVGVAARDRGYAGGWIAVLLEKE